MNKSTVIEKVSQYTEVDPETCEKVINGLEKVLQDELAQGGPRKALSAFTQLVSKLAKKD